MSDVNTQAAPRSIVSTDESFCDLVMKGGITSGVIYPKLVSKLASKYSFKNIGGTSAGAIAAGASAAAEYGRRHGNGNAFSALDKLPDELSAPTPPSGRSKLFSLFQPTPALQRHFNVLVAALNKAPIVAVRDMIQSLLLQHPVLLVLGLLVGSLLLLPVMHGVASIDTQSAWGVGAIAFGIVAVAVVVAARLGVKGGILLVLATPLLLAYVLHSLFGVAWGLRLIGVSVAVEVLALVVIAALVIIVLLRFSVTLLRGLHGNGYGLCSGRTAPGSPASTPGLTDWLTSYFNQLAGLPQNRPLTFGDLWGTSSYKAPRDINLEVMTSAITQQMIYCVPFRDGSPQFYYDPDVWKTLFPESVMQWLADALTQPTAQGADPQPAQINVVDATGKKLLPLPRRADLPVVVAVRMSLSFPVLLSAIPLFVIDRTRTENQNHDEDQEDAQIAAGGAPVKATKVWFSDGGIGSNIPLHMFDSLLPGHPTFAVNLKAEHPDFKIKSPEVADNGGGRIYLPNSNAAGHLRYTPPPNDAKPAGGLLSFLFSIVNTMQNWRDEIMFPYPGFRDRLVQISQRPTEGGLNLDMPPESIQALSNAGDMAAQRLVDRFHPSGSQAGAGWTEHQRVRLRTFLGVMQPSNRALEPSLSKGVWHAHVNNISAYNAAEKKLALDFLDALRASGSLGSPGASLEQKALKPLAQVRITPRI